ncbi:SixA phosphatase family protein [Neokomagataea anthophila]|uniref:Histidine phosphatase family protein n=1 Tax=Neokomagataea anthophila TaxID=2826925 RepID=A0ABS5E692_9PROT|nr:histidine phosphatase family protein [Neokomagataea anthophila]MBR0559321.1 histidine phosphatase family protein [Neokomagataea anthophila]
MIRHLLLLRHAEAGPYAQTEEGDRARALTARGIQQATQTGAILNALSSHHALDWSDHRARIICSPSTRTRQTAEISLQHSAIHHPPITFIDSLYSATDQHLLDTIQTVDEPISTLMLIGHNPAISSLVHTLCGSTLPDSASEILMAGYPPSSLSLFSTQETWYALRPSLMSFLSAHSA